MTMKAHPLAACSTNQIWHACPAAPHFFISFDMNALPQDFCPPKTCPRPLPFVNALYIFLTNSCIYFLIAQSIHRDPGQSICPASELFGFSTALLLQSAQLLSLSLNSSLDAPAHAYPSPHQRHRATPRLHQTSSMLGCQRWPGC